MDILQSEVGWCCDGLPQPTQWPLSQETLDAGRQATQNELRTFTPPFAGESCDHGGKLPFHLGEERKGGRDGGGGPGGGRQRVVALYGRNVPLRSGRCGSKLGNKKQQQKCTKAAKKALESFVEHSLFCQGSRFRVCLSFQFCFFYTVTSTVCSAV